MKISLLINMKMQIIVGIFIFISRENFMHSSVEHEKGFITSGLDQASGHPPQEQITTVQPKFLPKHTIS